jgi:hypothetical protein
VQDQLTPTPVFGNNVVHQHYLYGIHQQLNDVGFVPYRLKNQVDLSLV